MRYGRGLAVLLVLLMGSAAHAADANGHFMAQGSAGAICQELLAEGSLLQEGAGFGLPRMDRAWIAGYLTAYNQFTPGTYTLTTDITGMWHWIEQYCRLNPSNILMDAVAAYIGAARASRLTTAPATILPPVPAPPPIPVKSRK